METFEIAGLRVGMDCREGLLFDRSRAYLSDNQTQKTDFDVKLSEKVLKEKELILPQLTSDECRYVYMGEAFYYKLLNYNGIMLHASCIEKDGVAYLFSARSGTGKSTHTHLWMKEFDDVKMINDDKPAVRKIDGKFVACGTPFSGKNDESENLCIPIRAIIFLERSETNRIEHIPPATAIPLFLSQTIRPANVKYMDKALSVLDAILREIPVFRLKCDISQEAVLTAYNGINNYINGETI